MELTKLASLMILSLMVTTVPSWADEIIDRPLQPDSVSTSVPSVTETPVAASEPVAVATTTPVQVVPVVAVPVVVPVVSEPNQEVIAWQKLDGTVRSVDRNRAALTVRDREGKDTQVVMDKQVRIYRRGEQIPYSAVEPFDRVVLRYNPPSAE